MADLVVDSHQHFWDIARFEYPWMGPEVAPIAKTFMPPDLAPTLAELGIDRTVLVQARSALEDTTWFLELATEYDFIAGVVGWVDLLDPNLPRGARSPARPSEVQGRAAPSPRRAGRGVDCPR